MAIAAVIVAVIDGDKDRLSHPAQRCLVVGDAIRVPRSKCSPRKENVLPVVEINYGVSPARVLDVSARQKNVNVATRNSADRAVDEAGRNTWRRDSGRRLIIEYLAVLNGENIEAGSIIVGRR